MDNRKETAVKKTFVALLFLAATAHAQPVPSAYVPLAPCLLFDGNLPVGTSYLLVRGHCAVPAEANAVTLGVVADSTRGTSGLALWGSDRPWSGVVTVVVPKMESTETTVRLCYPEVECRGEDLAVRVFGFGVHAQLSVVGYFLPL